MPVGAENGSRAFQPARHESTMGLDPKILVLGTSRNRRLDPSEENKRYRLLKILKEDHPNGMGIIA